MLRASSALDPRTPVLVGIGTALQREHDVRNAQEPIALMIAAARAACADTGDPTAGAAVKQIAVPKGRWPYRNPAAVIARSIGARMPTTGLAMVGVLQQSLIADACGKIAGGDLQAALVVGGEAGYRIARSFASKVDTAFTDEAQSDPDLLWAPQQDLRHPIEIDAGLTMPVGLYAIMHSALRAKRGLSVSAHRDEMAERYSRFSEIAARNPHAWTREPLSPKAIREASPDNPMQAFPYTRRHCSNWSVDQAAALYFCSVGYAQAHGIARGKWIFPIASTESNHMTSVIERADLSACPGARLAGRAALDAAAQMQVSDIALFDLYSCFPLAVEAFAAELGVPEGADLTVTGAMPFAGGPYNNYVLQATARMGQLLRQSPEATGLVSSVSGALTKQGFGIWSTTQRSHRFHHVDVSAQVEREVQKKTVAPGYEGPASVAGYTVLHDRGRPPRAIVMADTPAGSRTIASTDDPVLVEQLQTLDVCGAPVQVHPGQVFTTSLKDLP